MSSYDPNKITFFGESDYRNRRTPFGIKADDRTRHMYVIGKTGMGKSTLLENMAIQDIANGEGLAFMDPHGKTADLLLEYIPEERLGDVVYFAPFDVDYPVSFNIMEDVGYDKRHLVVSGLMSAFRKIWIDAWSSRMEYILTNTLLALLETPGATLLSVNRMYTDKEYRKMVISNITDPSVKSFWVDEYSKYTDRYTQEATPAIQNKVGQFTSNPIIRNIIGQPHSSFDLRKMMDEKKILIINLSKGRIGEGNANLLGSMLVTKIYLAAMSRADLPDSEVKKLPNFYLHVDEFQSFANESFADILSEARKYKLNLTLAHQYIEQMPEEVRSAVFGNVGTMIMFRVGAFDAEVLEKEFAPVFTAEDMVNLGFTQIYLKLMIDGVTSHPFSAVTLPPVQKPTYSYRDEAVDRSRKNFAHTRTEVENAINEWYKPVELPSKAKEELKEELNERSAQAERSSRNRARFIPPEESTRPPRRMDTNTSTEHTHMPLEADRRNLYHTDRRTHGEARREEDRPPRRESDNRSERPPRDTRNERRGQQENPRYDERPRDERRNERPVRSQVDAPAERASLDTLRQRPPRGEEVVKPKGKGPSPEKLSGLKEALAGILSDTKAKEDTSVPAPKIEPKSETSPSPASESKRNTSQYESLKTSDKAKKHSPETPDAKEIPTLAKEVPREVLEDTLKVEKE